MNPDPIELMTLRDIVRYGATQFNKAELYFGHGTQNAWEEAIFLAMHELHLPFESYDDIQDCRLVEDEKHAILSLYQRRVSERIPAPYLVHEAWFAGLPFYVDENVLIPRSPMAEMIEAGFAPWAVEEPQTILDMCTGSGCIAIASSIYCPDALVTAVDISKDALKVAQKNIAKHNVEYNVELIESDLFTQLSNRQFDIIISNPPYVSDEEMATLPQEYLHEPDMALRAPDQGMEIVDKLLRESIHHLTEDGILIVEVGNTAIFVEERYPDLPIIWASFERGGDGVFVINRASLAEYFS